MVGGRSVGGWGMRRSSFPPEVLPLGEVTLAVWLRDPVGLSPAHCGRYGQQGVRRGRLESGGCEEGAARQTEAPVPLEGSQVRQRAGRAGVSQVDAAGQRVGGRRWSGP